MVPAVSLKVLIVSPMALTQRNRLVGENDIVLNNASPMVATVSPMALTQRNRLVGENDIVLNNVDTVYQVSHGRRKKLFPSSGILGHVKNLEIHCKDFRVHSFSFKFTPKNEAKQVVNAIVHHAFPTRLELLFAFDYSGHTESTELEPCVPRYKLVEEWEAEVDRLHATEYKTTLCNKAFRIASSLPECIVVPKSLDNAVIGEAAPQFVDYRIPVWSYTHPSSGASLVRMAETIPEPAHKDIEDKMLKAIKLSNISLKLPEVHDLGKLPVTLSDIQTSNEKLRELCMPSSRKEMQALDSNWFSRLEDTRWMSIVAICLGKALEVVKDLIDKKLTVVIKEESCCDLAPVISCLVQLLVDPACRSLHGFQALVEREWVALGHRFADRCGFVASPDTEQVM
ncbi:Myotubularin-related protein 10 [Lamellibrachia satsuma]|nr:Myotubularin-related protein 10 [Lamellibrachia satsuma]